MAALSVYFRQMGAAIVGMISHGATFIACIRDVVVGIPDGLRSPEPTKRIMNRMALALPPVVP